jgi:hypothetical protein
MSAPNPTKLDAGQVLQGAYDETTGRIRTDAEATIVNADIDVQLDPDQDGVHIGDKNSGNTLAIDSDGDIGVKIDANESSIEVFQIDPVDLQTTSHISVNNSPVTNSNPVPVSVQNPIDINNLPNNLATTDNQDITNGFLTTINDSTGEIASKLPNLGQNSASESISVILSSDQTPIEVTQQIDAFTKPIADNIQLVGSLDGTQSGQKYGIVYNARQQILDSHDRNAEFIYADFGTKDQRIVQINYTSDTFPGITVRRVFTYTLIGNKYRRDSETWSEII